MLIVRKDVSHSSEPQMVHDSISRAFCELFLGYTVGELALLFEAFSMLGLRGEYLSNIKKDEHG